MSNFSLLVKFRRFRGHRRILRAEIHPHVIAETEKDARLALIADYNSHGKKVVEIIRI